MAQCVAQVSGIEGNFRITCNITLRVLRANRDSLMAVLEAFVYDPLINWRLMESVYLCCAPDAPTGPIRS
jgi:phosphatidylinositol kinase/protein kinase (PI-3  family)